MADRGLVHRLSKICDVVNQIDNITIELNKENKKYKILIDDSRLINKESKKYLLVDLTENKYHAFAKQNEIIHHLNPTETKVKERDDFVDSEIIALKYAFRLKFTTHEIICFSENKAIKLCKAIEEKVKECKEVDWYYNIKDRVYVVECRR